MRPKSTVLLTLLGLGLVPVLLLAAINYWSALQMAETTLQTSQEHDLEHFSGEVNGFLTVNKHELTRVSRAKPLVQYLEPPKPETNNTPEMALLPATNSQIVPSELQALLSSVLNPRTKIASISVFRNSEARLFVAEQREFETYQPVDFRTKDFSTNQPQPDARVWSAQHPDIISSPVYAASVGSYIHFTIPVFSSQDAKALVGALLAEVKLDPVFFEAARADKSLSSDPTRMFIVVDRSGNVLYHTNEAVRDQPVNVSMPNFLPIAKQMSSGERGRAAFVGDNNQKFLTSYARLPALNVFVAQASDQNAAFADAHRNGLRGVMIATILGLVVGASLSVYWTKKSRGIQRVSEGVEAIAQGKLDHQIDLRSRDDLRPLADNLEVMKKQLRDQLAHEAETKQFQSFVRLSAILTHDLKNAIGALSLTVSNMERHSENAEFRIDAMKTLRNATDDLRALVARLSNPVTTLSGEHKLPRVVDLVPVLRRVISKTTGGGPQEVRLKLPESLPALVDVERIDTVIENLVVNAREAMAGKTGTLKVEAGLNADGKPFFSVGDEGEGMSRSFIQEHLFRPFATTKRRGVGLGLYTCREVIRANGGTIEVNSKTGVGTTFLVVLPSPPTDESREYVLRAH